MSSKLTYLIIAIRWDYSFNENLTSTELSTKFGHNFTYNEISNEQLKSPKSISGQMSEVNAYIYAN